MAGSQWVKDLQSNYEKDVVAALKPLGKRAMLHAYAVGHSDAPRSKGSQYVRITRGKTTYVDNKWRHKTGNLHDSFASAVYINGVLVRDSVEYLGGVMSNKGDSRTGKTGRETVDAYLERVSFGKKNNEIILIVVAAMFYTKWLEKDTYAGRFVIISPAREYIKQNIAAALQPVYKKYGVNKEVKPRVIRGEHIKSLSRYV